MFLRVLASLAISFIVVLLLPARKSHIREPRGGGQIPYREIVIFLALALVIYVILGLLGIDP